METKQITKQMYEDLKKPLDTKAVTKHPTKTYLSSIKAIYVTERLNEVFGCGNWQIRTKKICEGSNSMIVVKTTLTIPEYNVYYESFGGNDNGGENNKNFDLGDAYKGATTDAITKIGSYLGIGIEVFKGNGNTVPKSNDTVEQVAVELMKCTTEVEYLALWSKQSTENKKNQLIIAEFSKRKKEINSLKPKTE